MAINIEQVDAEELPPMEDIRRAPVQPRPAVETEHDRRMMERTMRRNSLRAARRLAD